MQKRFTAKDFIVMGMTALIFAMLLLIMYEIDRQWNKMSEMEVSLREQAKDIRKLRKNITSGSVDLSQSGATKNLDDIPDSFKRAVAATQRQDYSEGDWLVDAFATGIKTLTPFVSTDKYASDVQSFVFERLLAYDPDTLELIGHIARSWTVSPDGLTITYKMRDDVVFSDGVKMTAHDVVFTYEFTINEAIDAPRERAYYRRFKSVKALDDYTVEFKFKEPYYNSLLQSGAMEILPKHFYSKYLKKPEEFNQSKGLLLGSGPYRVKDPAHWTPDKGQVELIRNDRYWGPVIPAYDKIIWRIIEHDSARLTTFRNGEIDTYSARPIEYNKLRNDSALMSRVQNFEYMPPINGYSYIGWNQKRDDKDTMFADKRVRQAMTYLIDREKIIQEIQLGYAEIAVSPFNPQSAQHDANIKPREQNIEKAKALLKEAGFEDRNGDGILEDTQGKNFEFELIFINNSDDNKRLALMLKDFYARAGIVLKLKATEWPVMLEAIDKKDFEAIVIGWTSVVETDLYQAFHSSQTVEKGDNFVSYKNKKLDKLIEAARSTTDRGKRMSLWHQCEKILFEDQPYTFLYRRKFLIFVDKRFKNLQVTNFGLTLKDTPLESYVPLSQQRYTP